jgi:hypothetical protein
VRDRAAVGVGAQVGGRGEELRDQVPVGAVKFDPVEACVDGAPGGVGVRPGLLEDRNPA